ncbi:DNA replication complex GINS protein [Sparassis crispa]|uniref:DNA replication complex GINS protein PSF1 n=1 Tax=Sparassis crispa TaxID=139825 RepID=A0A401GZK6_9APHY|nr:DNA replication complex GINS protein [Sparassis crispa]GBE87569.1 DNA replication complex GINS protein [Sparassis crispa]
MSSTHLQYGDLATQLLTESRRSTATDTLLKYNDVLVRSILREQRQLEDLLQTTLNTADQDPAANNPKMPTVLLYQTAILRNKRCLLAYHHHRLERLKDLYWSVGGALPLLLSMPSASASQNVNASGGGNGGPPVDVRSKLSPHEVDFLRSYAVSLLTLRTEAFAADAQAEDVDLLAPITRPPKDLHILVRVVRDCGVVHTEQGAIDFRPGHRFLVRRSDVEHLIMQGFLEEI